ncbi:PIN-like domain-containing protein [Nostoc sp.]|uniref:PIN-like domain-containing protein n=1 Tax=Nostoc sp. TaxID=1180 RepID=UPI002FF91443
MNMRDLFPGYYQPTEQEFAELWKECIFSFDTNVLLHIYRYSAKTRERLFDILQKLQQRIWIPYQIGWEYHKNRLDVISQQSKAYDKIVKILEDNLKIEKIGSLKKDLDTYKKHPLIDVKQIILTVESSIQKVIKIVKDDLQYSKIKHPDLIKNDEFHDKIIDLLNGRIGNNKDKLKDIYNWAEERFKYCIPPGYEDAKKPVPDKYGDAITWFQLINYAKSEKKPIIFVTDDDKEDWWLKGDGKTISPRPELVQEMLSEAGVRFHMYSADRFLEYAEDFLKLPNQPEVIEEAREIRIQDAASQNLSDVIEEITDSLNHYSYASEYKVNERTQSLAELTKINSTIAAQIQNIADITKTSSAIAETLKSVTEIPKINLPALELTRVLADFPKINSSFAEFLGGKNDLAKFGELTRSITEIPKINLPFVEFIRGKNDLTISGELTRSITEIPKINLPFVEFIRGKNDLTISGKLMRSITEIPKINSLFTDTEFMRGKNDLTKFPELTRSITDIIKINLPI